MNGAPARCQHCGQPFQVADKHVAAWRSSDGRYYCNEFCAEGAEETYVPERRKAS